MDVWEATPEDAGRVLAFVQAKAEFDRGLGAFNGRLGTTEELIRRHLFGRVPRAYALLAGDRREPVGFAFYYFRYSSFQGRPSIWLDDLFVRPDQRRHGAGRLLVGRLAQVAAAEDCTHMAWVASASNAEGMNFYRRLGARVIHTEGDTVTLQFPAADFHRLATEAGLGAGADGEGR